MLPTKESETIEFKKSLSELKEGIISLVSMLNKRGEARLYFGIKNDGEVFGQPIGEMTTTKLTNEIKNYIKPLVFPKIDVINVDNKDIIKVTVLANDSPYSAYGRYYIRVDDQDLEMPQADLEEAFVNKNITYSKWENTLTKYDINEVDEEFLIEYLNAANESNRLNYRYKDVNDALTKLGLMENNRLNNAGYYLFSKNKPLTIKLAIFASKERTSFLDNRRFEGNIFQCIEEAQKYINSNIHYYASIIGYKRVEIPEVPIEAIREIVINSFVHMRVTPGEHNEIIITPERIRIYNPGTIALNKNPDDFAKGIIGSKIRNPLIALTLYKNKSIEAFGTGFKRVFDLCKKYEIQYEYKNDEIGFYFEFLRNPNPNFDKIFETNDTITIQKEELNKTENILTQYMKNHENKIINATKVAQDLNKSRITIQRTIKSLVEKNLIKRVGSNKTGYWELS